jgi:RNA polymerase sigma-70 factor, ECF subfamily
MIPEIEKQDQRDKFIQELTCGMASGSESAYRQFYESYFDRLYRQLLYLSGGNEDLTRDLVQTVLLRVVRYIKVFHNERVLWAWLRQVCRSCHVDWLRRNGHELEPVSLYVLTDSACLEPLGEEQEELIAALDTVMAELPPEEREVVQLAYFEGLSQKTLASHWNTTPKAVESRLARIRQKLRKAILEKLKTYALF